MDSNEEQLKRQLEACVRENKRLRLQVQEKDEELVKKDKDIAKKDKDIAKKDRAIQRVNKENVHYKQNTSIEGLWRAAFSTKFVIKKAYGSVSTTHVDPKRKTATAEEASFTLLRRRLVAKILKKSSTLLSLFDQVKKVGDQYCRVNTYANEADVQGFVQAALMDAVKILNGLLGGEEALLTARREASIFSNRPDHVVVGVGSLGTPIFVAETKQPKKKPTNELQVPKIHDKVWGQIYDYHEIMRVVGHCNPFIVLSTFDHSWVTWVKSNENCNTIAAATNKDTRFTKPLEDLKNHFSRHLSSKTPSPRKEAAVVENCSNATTNRTKRPTKRELCRSEPYESDQLVKLFVNAIACSLCNFHASNFVVRNEHGYQLTNKPVLTLTAHDYCFESISLKVVPGEFKSSNFAKETQFHVLDLLGSGRTSKAFLATTPKGHECVLKMYVRKYDETKNYLALTPDQINDDAEKSTTTERKMYKRIYDMDIPVITLFNHLCLILPYFCQVQHGEHAVALQELEELLQTNFRVQEERHVLEKLRLRVLEKLRLREITSTKYYNFSRSDLVWRHCGYYTGKNNEKSLIVFDLAELQECRTEEEHNIYIQHHINTLKGRIPPAPDSKAAPSQSL